MENKEWEAAKQKVLSEMNITNFGLIDTNYHPEHGVINFATYAKLVGFAFQQSNIDRIKDYEEVLSEHRELVKKLDVIINGDNAAEQASLCDLVKQAPNYINRIKELEALLSKASEVETSMHNGLERQQSRIKELEKDLKIKNSNIESRNRTIEQQDSWIKELEEGLRLFIKSVINIAPALLNDLQADDLMDAANKAKELLNKTT